MQTEKTISMCSDHTCILAPRQVHFRGRRVHVRPQRLEFSGWNLLSTAVERKKASTARIVARTVSPILVFISFVMTFYRATFLSGREKIKACHRIRDLWLVDIITQCALIGWHDENVIDQNKSKHVKNWNLAYSKSGQKWNEGNSWALIILSVWYIPLLMGLEIQRA